MIHTFPKARIQCGDIMAGLDDLMQGETVDIIYSDPPWGQGNLSYWQTINNRQTGAQVKKMDYEAFMFKFFEIATEYCKQYLFIEYGQRWRMDIIKLAHHFGWIDNGTVEAKYKSGSRFLPLDIHLLTKAQEKFRPYYQDSIKQTYGLATPAAVITPVSQPGMKILDPCCGTGFTAQVAIDTGMFFYGNELNAVRLEKTLQKF